MSQQLLNSRLISLKAGADLSEKIYYLCKLDTSANEQVVLATADAVCIGVIQNKPKTGEAVTIAIGETTKVVAGGSITRGDLIVSDSSGKGIARTTEHNVFGIALESGASGEIIEVLVRPIYM